MINYSFSDQRFVNPEPGSGQESSGYDDGRHKENIHWHHSGRADWKNTRCQSDESNLQGAL